MKTCSAIVSQGLQVNPARSFNCLYDFAFHLFYLACNGIQTCRVYDSRRLLLVACILTGNVRCVVDFSWRFGYMRYSLFCSP